MKTAQSTTSIIIIEPNMINQMVARLALQQMGCEVKIVENSEKALSMEKACCAADLVLVNIELSRFSDCISHTEIRRLKKKLAALGIPMVEYFVEKEKSDNSMFINMCEHPGIDKSHSQLILEDTIRGIAA